MAYSKRYVEMIDNAYKALKANKANWKVPPVWRKDPWMAFQETNPMSVHTIKAVEARESYELSWNQCCIAVSKLLEEMITAGV
jgi:hypothetical protein